MTGKTWQNHARKAARHRTEVQYIKPIARPRCESVDEFNTQHPIKCQIAYHHHGVVINTRFRPPKLEHQRSLGSDCHITPEAGHAGTRARLQVAFDHHRPRAGERASVNGPKEHGETVLAGPYLTLTVINIVEERGRPARRDDQPIVRHVTANVGQGTEVHGSVVGQPGGDNERSVATNKSTGVVGQVLGELEGSTEEVDLPVVGVARPGQAQLAARVGA